MAMRRILWTATAAKPLDVDDFADLADAWRRRHRAGGLRCTLIYAAATFMGILEGPRDRVGSVWAEIRMSKIHWGIDIISDTEVPWFTLRRSLDAVYTNPRGPDVCLTALRRVLDGLNDPLAADALSRALGTMVASDISGLDDSSGVVEDHDTLTAKWAREDRVDPVPPRLG